MPLFSTRLEVIFFHGGRIRNRSYRNSCSRSWHCRFSNSSRSVVDNFEVSADLIDDATTGARGFELGNLPRTDEIARIQLSVRTSREKHLLPDVGFVFGLGNPF